MIGVRLGLIGYGYWGSILAKSLVGVADTTLTAIAASGRGGAPDTADTALFADWRQLLAQPGLDGVIIATPPALHFEMAQAALERGLGVFLEKPMTVCASDGHALVALAQQTGAILQLDHIDMFNPAWQAVRDNLDQIGAIASVEASFGGNVPVRHEAAVHWDWGAHPIALCVDICGAPAEVTLLGNQPAPSGPGRTVRFALSWHDGRQATIETSDCLDVTRRRLAITGELGTLTYDDRAADKATLTHDGRTQALAVGDGRPVTLALQRFVNAIRACRPSWQDAVLGAAVVDILVKIDAAIQD